MLKLLGLHDPLNRPERIRWIIRLTVVFPFDPVTATTVAGTSDRWYLARLPNAAVVSGTVITPPEKREVTSGRGSPSRRTIAPAHPASAAWERKVCPSNRSPRIATNSSPGLAVRVSVVTASITAAAPRAIHLPWMAVRISSRGSGFIAVPPWRRLFRRRPGRRRNPGASRRRSGRSRGPYRR